MGQTITASFGLDINPLKAGFNRAASVASNAARSIGTRVSSFITSPLLGISAAVSGFLTYQTFKGGIEGVIDTGAELEKLHKQTGVAVGSLATLRAVFHQADVSADGLGHSVAIMQRNLFQAEKVGGPAGSALRLLKLNIDDLVQLRPEIQFQKIGSAIAGLPSPLARSTAAMAIFGKSGAEMLPVFEELQNADFGSLSQKSAILEKDAAKFEEITVGFRRARGQLQGVFLGMADQLAPTLLGLSKVINVQNALAFGEVLGAEMRNAAHYLVGAFEDPTALADTVANALSYAGASFSNLVLNGLMVAAVSFGNALLDGVDVMIRAVEAGMKYAFVNALSHIPGTHMKGITARQAWGQTSKTPFGKLAADARGTVSETDFFGPAKFLTAAKAAADKLGKAGAPILDFLDHLGDSAKKSSSSVAALGSLTNNGGLRGGSIALGAADFASLFSKGNFGSLLWKNGMTNEISALAKHSPWGQSPLLNAGERRGFEDAAVARGGLRSTSTAGAFAAVRSGDHARRKAEEKHQLVQKMGLDETNEKLESILGVLKDGLTGEG